jgi:ketosteroid isomerase-like protein
MSEHPNTVTIRAAVEALQRGDLQTVAGYMDDDIVWHVIGSTEPIRGKQALAASMAGADYQITGTVHDVLANDDHAVVLAENVAKRGGRSLTYRTAEIVHVRDGKVTERWAFSDDTAAIEAFFA